MDRRSACGLDILTLNFALTAARSSLLKSGGSDFSQTLSAIFMFHLWKRSTRQVPACARMEVGQENTPRRSYLCPPTTLQANFVLHAPHINRRGIYKDTCASSHGFTDYQLRPNAAIAMTVAPELFTTRRARRCLDTMRDVLLGGMGMRTLDPSDMQYRPSYDNSNDSTVKMADEGVDRQ